MTSKISGSDVLKFGSLMRGYVGDVYTPDKPLFCITDGVGMFFIDRQNMGAQALNIAGKYDSDDGINIKICDPNAPLQSSETCESMVRRIVSRATTRIGAKKLTLVELIGGDRLIQTEDFSKKESVYFVHSETEMTIESEGKKTKIVRVECVVMNRRYFDFAKKVVAGATYYLGENGEICVYNNAGDELYGLIMLTTMTPDETDFVNALYRAGLTPKAQE